jgi:hypothetical protein
MQNISTGMNEWASKDRIIDQILWESIYLINQQSYSESIKWMKIYNFEIRLNLLVLVAIKLIYIFIHFIWVANIFFFINCYVMKINNPNNLNCFKKKKVSISNNSRKTAKSKSKSKAKSK